MDAIVLLKEDHKLVEKLFKRFEKAGDAAYEEKRKVVDQVILALTQHAYCRRDDLLPNGSRIRAAD